jgi:nucleoside-diphosphate-sugar epimerase
MKILVVGAGGYIGIPLCGELVQRGHDVIGIDRFFFGKMPPCKIIAHDIRSLEKDFFFDIPDAVIDLCGLSNDASADIDPNLTRAINLEGGKRLATQAKQAGVKRYVYSSSASVYGHGGPDLTEDSLLQPLTLYAECKAKVEDHIRSLDGDGFETVILRNATVFGLAPRMRFDLVANIMALTAWRDHQITVRGGDQWRPMIHVRDLVEAFVRCVSPDWEIQPGTYNIGQLNITMNNLAKAVNAAIPWAKIVRVSEAVDQRDYHLSFAKAGSRFSTSSPVSIFQGAAEIIAALRNEEVSADDPTTMTLGWYKQLIAWEKRLNEIRLDGRIL